MARPAEREILTIGGRDVAITNPGKVLFPGPGYTKRDLVNYYLAVAPGALRAAGGRPNVLVRHPDGLGSEFFYQKRAPVSRPDWVEVVALRFPSGRQAEEVVPREAAVLAWMANLACFELHPHPVRAEDLDHPDELRVDLDPVPGVAWDQLREVARVVRATLDDLGLTGWPKTSGSRGIHIYVRIAPRWTFTEVRRAALALAREVERRAPGAGHQQVVEGRAARRLPRLQPEREGPHHGRCLLGAPDRRRARVGAAHVGGAGDSRPGRLHPGDDAGALCRRGRPARRHGRRRRGARWAAGAVGAPGEGRPRRRPVAAALREAGGRAAAGAAVEAPRPSRPLIEIGRAPTEAAALAGLERWKARHEAAAARLQPADVLVDRMRGRSSTWTRIRVNLEHVPAAERPAQEALDPDDAPGDPHAVSGQPRPRRKPSRARTAS